MPNLIAVAQKVQTQVGRYIGEIEPLVSRISRSLKAIETDTDRSGTYESLSMIGYL